MTLLDVAKSKTVATLSQGTLNWLLTIYMIYTYIYVFIYALDF